MKKLQDIRTELLRQLGRIDNRPEERGCPYRFAPGWRTDDEDCDVLLHDGEDELYINADTGDERAPDDTLHRYIFVGFFYYKGEPFVIGLPADYDITELTETDWGEVSEFELNALTTDSLADVWDVMRKVHMTYEPFAKSVEELPHTALGAASIENIKDEALCHPVTEVSFGDCFPESSYQLDQPVTTLHELIKAIQGIIQKDFDRCWCVGYHAITDLCIEVIDVENGTAEVTLGT